MLRTICLTAATAAVMCLAAGCGSDGPAAPVDQPAVLAATATRSAPAISGGATVVLAPRDPSGRLVVYVHGAGETSSSITQDPQKAPIVAALLNAGYTVAAADAEGDAWGNPLSTADYGQLIKAVPHKRLYVIGQSMGGLAAMQLADLAPVRALALIYPVCDLASMRTGPYGPSIEAAWGPDVQRASNVLSPVVPAKPLAMHFWASPDDTVVSRDENTAACAAVAEQHGSKVIDTETTGNHGDGSNFDAPAVLALFNGA